MRACPSPAWAASRTGKTPPSFCFSAPPVCKSARPSCTTAFASLKTFAMAFPDWMDSKGLRNHRRCQRQKPCRASPTSKTSISPSAPSPESTTERASSAISATSPVTTRRISALTLSPTMDPSFSPIRMMRARMARQEAVGPRPQPRVREEDCVGCRLCYNVCPVENCIEMVELPPCRPSTTWDQLSKTQPAVTEDWEAMKAYREEQGIHIH